MLNYTVFCKLEEKKPILTLYLHDFYVSFVDIGFLEQLLPPMHQRQQAAVSGAGTVPRVSESLAVPWYKILPCRYELF